MSFAYGFIQFRHLAGERVQKVGERAIMDAITLSAQRHTEMVGSMLGSLVQRTTDFKVKYHSPGSDEMQVLDDNGNPKPVFAKASYDVAFPIYGKGTAWGTNRISRAKMTVDEANRQTISRLKADSNTMYREIMASLFTDTPRVFDDAEHGALMIQPLANDDGATYLKYDQVGADNHYRAQAEAISNAANPFPGIYDALKEHPENMGDVVCFIPESLRDSVEGLSGYTEVIDVRLRAASDERVINATNFDAIRSFGDEVLGRVDKCWVVLWRRMPDGYVVAHTSAPSTPVLGMREHSEPSLQGLFTENFSPDGNLMEARLLRYNGFGALNRVGAVVQRIGSGSYVIPEGFEAPLAR